MTISTNKPKRRWLRFSLRSLLLLILVIALSLGWMIHKVREQGIAVAALREMGCDVHHEYADPSGSPTVLEWLRKLLGEAESRSVNEVIGERSQITDAGLRHLVGMSELNHLNLSFTQVSDAGLVYLRGLTELKDLNLEHTQVTDAGLIHLGGLTQLGWLNLDDTQVTDAGLVHLRGLIELETLELNHTQVADAGLVHLRELLQLHFLTLNGTKVTDAGLENLGRLKQLQGIFFDETKVTDAGVRRLQKALPKCDINWQFGKDITEP